MKENNNNYNNKEPEREELRPSFVPILDADALNSF